MKELLANLSILYGIRTLQLYISLNLTLEQFFRKLILRAIQYNNVN